MNNQANLTNESELDTLEDFSQTSIPLASMIDYSPLIVNPDLCLAEVLRLISDLTNNYQLNSANIDSSENLIHSFNVSCVLVEENEQLVGLLTERDFVRFAVQQLDFKTVKVREVMTTNLITVTESDCQELFNILSLFRQYSIRHLPIINQENKPIGVITTENIRQFLRPVYLLRILKIEEVLNTKVITASPQTSVLEIAKLMNNHQISCVIIVETKSYNQTNKNELFTAVNSIPIGIITERDIIQFQALELNLELTKAEMVMSCPLFTLTPQSSLWEAQILMQKTGINHLVICGQLGELKGLISRTNILKALDPLEMSKLIQVLQEKINHLEANYQISPKKIAKSQYKKNNHLEILVVEDNKNSFLLLRVFLKSIFPKNCTIIHTMSLAETEEKLSTESFDIILLDLNLPDSQGLDTIKYLQARFQELTIIILTGYDDWELQEQALHLGVQDYLCKDILGLAQKNITKDILKRSILYAIERQTNLNYLQEKTLELNQSNYALRTQIEESELLRTKLASSEKEMQSFFEGMTDIVLKVDRELTNISIAPTNYSLLYNKNQDILSLTIAKFYEDPDFMTQVNWALLSKTIVSFEYSLLLNNQEYWFSTTINPISENEVSWVARDITRTKQMDLELKQLNTQLEQRVKLKTQDLELTVINLQKEIKKREKIQKTLHYIANAISYKIGEDFFASLVEYLAKVLNMEYTLLGKINENREIETVVVYHQGKIIDNFTYDLANSPCGNITHEKLCIYKSNVQQEFPLDQMIKNINAQSYIGVPLFSEKGVYLGLIVALSSQPLQEDLTLISEIIQIFATRVVVELERQQAQLQLIQNEKNLNHILTNIYDAILIVDEQGIIHFGNYRATILFQKPLDELIGFNFGIPIVSNQNQKSDIKIVNQDGIFEFQEMRVVETNWQDIPAYIITLHDVTESKQYEQALQELNQNLELRVKERTEELMAATSRLTTLMENLEYGILVKDELEKVVLINQAFCNMYQLDLPPASLIGADFSHFEQDYQHFFTDPETVLRENYQIKTNRKPVSNQEIKFSSDKIFEQNFVPIFINNNYSGHLWMYRDITNDKANELYLQNLTDQLKKTNQELSYFKLALDQASMVSITDHKGIITYANDEFCKLSQYNREELIGKTHKIVNSGYHPPEFWQKLWTIIGQGKIWRAEVKNKKKEGGFYWSDTVIVPFLDQQNQPFQYMAIRQDITWRKQAEETINKNNQLLTIISNAQSQFIIDINLFNLFDYLLDNLLKITNSKYGFIGEIVYTQLGETSLEYPYFKIRGQSSVKTNIQININNNLTGLNSELENTSYELEVQCLQTLFRSIITTGKSVIITNCDRVIPNPNYKNNFSINSFLGMPFYINNQLIGMVVIANSPDGYDLDLIEFLQPLINTCANIINAYRNDQKRKAIEKSLEEKLAIIDTTNDGIGILKNEHFIYLNKSHLTMFGYDQLEDLLGYTWRKLQPEIGSLQTEKEILPTLQKNRYWTGEIIGIRKNGSLFPVEISLTLMDDETMIAVCRDITEKKEKEANFRSIFEQAAVGIALVNLDGHLIEFNQKFCDILGYSKTTIKEKTIFEFSEAEDVNTTLTLFKKCLKGEITGYSNDQRYRHQNGSLIWGHITASLVKNLTGKDDYLIALLEDITPQKTAELQRDRYFNLSVDMISICGYDGYFKALNPAWEKTTGYSNQQLQNSQFFTFVHPDDLEKTKEVMGHFIESTTSHTIQNFENRYLCKNSQYKWISWNAVSFPEEKLVYAIARDVTIRKETELALEETLRKEQELNELKSRFISMTSHEFRTPLAVIASSAGILKTFAHKLSDDQKQDHLNTIQTYVKHTTSLLDDILLLNRAETGRLSFNPSDFDVIEFCQTMKKEIQLSTDKHLIIFKVYDQEMTAFDLDQEPKINVYLDLKLLRQILINLLSNAIKYSPDGGLINFNLINEENQIIFQIKDQGMGIPLEDHSSLFSSFYRAKNVGTIQGTGLGLNIAKKCIELQGGEITFSSEVGKGTTFFITLPKGKNQNLSNN